MGNKPAHGKIEKYDKKQLLFVLKLPSEKEFITKDEWFAVVSDRLTAPFGECRREGNFYKYSRNVYPGDGTGKTRNAHRVVSFNVFDVTKSKALTQSCLSSVFEMCYLYELSRNDSGAKLTEDDKFEIRYMAELIFQEAGLSKNDTMSKEVFIDISTRNSTIGKMLKIF